MKEEECQNALDEVKSFLTQFILSILVIFLFLLRDSITKTTYKKKKRMFIGAHASRGSCLC